MNKNGIYDIEITDVNNLGNGVGRIEGKAVFVRGGADGDTLRVRIIKDASDYAVARIEKILIPSPHRTVSDCGMSGRCGGCVYRNITYAHELELKRAYVENAFRKAGLCGVTVHSVEYGEQYGYRNKVQYPLSPDMKPGFFRNHTHTVVPSDNCLLEDPAFDGITSFCASFLASNGVRAYDESTGKGLLRHIYLRSGRMTGQIMLCLVINGNRIKCQKEFIAALTEKFPAVKTVLLNVNTSPSNVILSDKFEIVYGDGYIEDEICGLKMRISAASFWQVNRDMAERLYNKAAQLAALKDGEKLIDLYCGIGSIGLSVIKDKPGSDLIGVEVIPAAVENAKENAAINGIENALFICADAGGDILKSGAIDHADVIITDPPRKGCPPELLEKIADSAPRALVYVSCNPDTLARDCKIMEKYGYTVKEAFPFDLFPRTGHVESVVLLSRGKNVHYMKLNSEPFEMIKNGQKTIELRLFDEKRQMIKSGDEIVFTNTADGRTLKVTVARIHRFDTFEELYKSLPLLQCGYTRESVKTASPSDMESYYSAEEQKRYGVVGIEIFRPDQTTDETVVLMSRGGVETTDYMMKKSLNDKQYN